MLKWLILLDSLVLGIFALLVAFISKFVDFLEIEMELSVIAISCFVQFSLGGFQFIFLIKDRIPNRATAKRVVSEFVATTIRVIFTNQ